MWQLIVTVTMVIGMLLIFQSGWLLEFLNNFPFIDNIASIVAGYLDISSGIIVPETKKVFLEEILRSFLFLLNFALISKVMHSVLYIGKHEKAGGLLHFLATPLEWIASNFFSAVLTGILIDIVVDYLIQTFNASILITAGFSILTIIITVILAFISPKKTLKDFLIQMLVGVLIPALVKLIAIEFITIFMYCALNIEGIFDEINTIFIIIVGITCCFGSILGAEKLGNEF